MKTESAFWPGYVDTYSYVYVNLGKLVAQSLARSQNDENDAFVRTLCESVRRSTSPGGERVHLGLQDSDCIHTGILTETEDTQSVKHPAVFFL